VLAVYPHFTRLNALLLSVTTYMFRGLVCVLLVVITLLVLVLSVYTAQSDPAQPKEDAKQKWSRVSHTYKTINRISFYKVYNEPQTWFDASKTCAKDGSHLLIINSAAEATEVKGYLDSKVDTYINGFHDLFAEGNFTTVQCKYMQRPL